ncbi:MAG TPA: hypothetical protein VGF28_04825 [Thermoanaerobaculia bacterium]|jgi:hypothetical protein
MIKVQREDGTVTLDRSSTTGDAALFDELVVEAVLQTGGTPFFAVAPVTAAVRAAPAVISRVTDELLDSVIGYLPAADVSLLGAHLAERRRIASYEEWVVGSCTAPFDRPPAAGFFSVPRIWNTDTFCEQIDRLRCLAVYFGETGEAILWTPQRPSGPPRSSAA